MTSTGMDGSGSPTPAGFAALAIEDWRQFDSVHLRFHSRLTILTGANATGKSTILSILARHFNWTRAFSTAPVRTRSEYGWVSVGRKRARKWARDRSYASVGKLTYGTGIVTDIQVPPPTELAKASHYDLLLTNQQPVTGSFITSHRTSSGNYTPVQQIPTSFAAPDDLYEQFTQEARTRWQGGWTGRSPQQALKEALMSAAVFSVRNNPHVHFNRDAASVWDGFQEILKLVMPASLGYQGMHIRSPDLVIETSTGDFIIDDASGGLAAIIEVAWSIFLRSRTEFGFTVLMDEPENHLHPSLQKEFMPGLVAAFPHVQFIVATHSPFVVTATPDSSVYALHYNEARRVVARGLDYANKAASADETLREVLGVGSTVPSWAETAFRRVLKDYPPGTLNDERLRQLRRDLAALGLEAEFPTAIMNLTSPGEQGRPG
ncbi:AAA family ATPase [Terrabacter sp. NPDC080008]|uniref:AAA family ATPase n=1 Tax=Terrabacter sp. NPDC080008 TaxID=3155176 RepID=UPI00344F62E3